MKTILVFASQTIRILTAILICTVIAFPPSMTAFAAPDFPPIPEEPHSGAYPYSGPIPPASVTAFIDDIANGRLGSRPIKDADVFHLTNQELQIFDHEKVRSYNFNQNNVEIPYVPFTGLKIVYDSESKNLMFDAYRGLDKNGENGILVARQTIHDIDVLASAQDAELFQFVDSKLKLHVIDLGLVALQLFKSPIPVFQNLWEPTAEARAQWSAKLPDLKLRSGFLTHGSQPLDLVPAIIAPHDHQGNVRLNAGDFYLSFVPNDAPAGTEGKALAIFARETTYSQMLRGYQTLQWQAALLTTDTTIQNQVEKVIDEVQSELDRQELRLQNEKMSPQARVIIGSLNVSTLKSLENRRQATKSLKANSFDNFTESEWLSTYSEIATALPAETTDKSAEESWFKFIGKINERTIAADRAFENTPEKEVTVSKLKSIRKALTGGTALKSVAVFLTVGAVGLPYAYDNFQVLSQIRVIAWSYDVLFPSVLKDAIYRTPLLLSIAALAAIWPAGVGFSAVVGKTLLQMADNLKSETTRKAIYIKDLAKNWGNLNNWQRITSYGMRLYAWMILPYWRVLIEHIAQQKTFFSAVNNGMNPMQKLLADSELGKKLGLTTDQRIGLNRVFSPKKEEDIERNLKMQSAVKEENRKLDSVALLVAATLVAEKHKMDPALLMMLGKESADGLELDKISALLDTPEMKAEWQMLSHLLVKEMMGLKKQSVVVDENLKGLIEQYYAAAEKIAKKIDAMGSQRRQIERFRMAFSSQMSNKLIAAANFAVQDHEFLKNVYTNEFVSDQVKKEFSVDHLMVVGIVALYGERADLSHPEHLAADVDGFLWTSKAHWYDIFQNTFVHFFIAGAQMALVFQKVRPQVAANYAPIEDYKFESRPREQGLWSATKDWMAVFNPIKSDLGGIVIKRFAKRFTTMTAGITLMAILRVGIWDQPVEVALMAWSFSFITAQWFFGWIWDPVQRGNQMEGERLEATQDRLKVARRNINRGDLEEGRNELTALYRSYNPQVLKLFDLSKMSKNELLFLSVDQPPVFTMANKWLSWITTWTAAVGSTVLAIPLSVILMDEKLLRTPETWYKWIPISIAFYTASYFLSAKYATKYRDYWLTMKAKWTKSAGATPGATVLPISATPRGGGRCEALFVPSAS